LAAAHGSHHPRFPNEGMTRNRGWTMLTLNTRAIATAVVGAIAFGTVGLGSARAADLPYSEPPQSYGPPPGYEQPPAYQPAPGYAPRAYAPPPVYVAPPPVVYGPPVIYGPRYGYGYGPVYRGPVFRGGPVFAARGRFWHPHRHW